MNIQFFASRTIARNAAKESGGKLQDHGTDTAPGKRWGVIVPDCVAVATHEATAKRDAWDNLARSGATLHRVRNTNNRRSGSRVTHVTGKNNQAIPVTWQRKKSAYISMANKIN